MLDIGFYEILLILVLALLVLGPEQLPRVAKSLGRAIGTIRRLAAEFQYTLEESVREEDETKRRREDAEKAGKAAAVRSDEPDDPYGIGSVPSGSAATTKTDPDAAPLADEPEPDKDDGDR